MVAPKSPAAADITHAQVAAIVRELIENQLVALGAKGTAAAWWDADAGRFANDPVFDEMIRLGRKAREAERPKRKATKRARSRH